MGSAPAFEVDRTGLAKLLARRGVSFAVLELIQNALDEPGVTCVAVEIERINGSPYVRLAVEDDAPDGFHDLSHAYTLYAESKKKGSATRRGFMNLGDKLVVALCRRASIESTTGAVVWEGDRRKRTRARREAGSRFVGELRMDWGEINQCKLAVHSVIVPDGIRLTYNSEPVRDRGEPLGVAAATLPTMIADHEGYMRRTKRKCEVRFCEPLPGEKPTLYEMGIPVVAVDCAWHVDVQQRVPLNADRDNVTPAYMREVLALALQTMHRHLDDTTAAEPWVSEALESESTSAEAAGSVLTHRFGDKRVIADPSDREGEKLAVSKGYSVIHGGGFSRAAWETIKRTGAALPAGQVTPGPRAWSDSPDAERAELLPYDKWKPEHRRVAAYAVVLGRRLLGVAVDVQFCLSTVPWSAAYGPRGRDKGVLTFASSRTQFPRSGTVKLDELLIHELAHHASGDHLSERYHDELCRLGAALKELALDHPELFVGPQ